MARRLLEETKDVQTKKGKQKKSEDNIYKFDFEPDFEQTEEPEKIVQHPPKSKRGRKKKE